MKTHPFDTAFTIFVAVIGLAVAVVCFVSSYGVHAQITPPKNAKYSINFDEKNWRAVDVRVNSNEVLSVNHTLDTVTIYKGAPVKKVVWTFDDGYTVEMTEADIREWIRCEEKAKSPSDTNYYFKDGKLYDRLGNEVKIENKSVDLNINRDNLEVPEDKRSRVIDAGKQKQKALWPITNVPRELKVSDSNVFWMFGPKDKELKSAYPPTSHKLSPLWDSDALFPPDERPEIELGFRADGTVVWRKVEK